MGRRTKREAALYILAEESAQFVDDLRELLLEFANFDGDWATFWDGPTDWLVRGEPFCDNTSPHEPYWRAKELQGQLHRDLTRLAEGTYSLHVWVPLRTSWACDDKGVVHVLPPMTDLFEAFLWTQLHLAQTKTPVGRCRECGRFFPGERAEADTTKAIATLCGDTVCTAKAETEAATRRKRKERERSRRRYRELFPSSTRRPSRPKRTVSQ